MERVKLVGFVLCSLVQVLTCLLLVGETRAQASSDHNGFWYDVPSAPLKFTLPEFDPNYAEMQMVQIRSTPGEVVRYDLGCIHLEKGKPLATDTIRSWQLDQAPEDQLFPRNVLRITAHRCIEKSEFLGVVRVQYQDGGVWQLPGRQ